MSNFTEELFDAIQLITDKTLSKIEMDKTIICRITDASKKSEGKYRVRNNDLSFWAFCENDTYAEGDEVRVVIPSDTTAQKYIIGKYVSDDGSPVAYVSPADSVINISGDLIGQAGTLLTFKAGSNSDLKKYHRIWAVGESYANITSNGVYDTIVIKGDFRTLLKEDRAGEYGIEMHVYIEDNETMQDHAFTFSCKEMFGDPYDFQVYTPQSKAFVLPNTLGTTARVTAIGVMFYQTGFQKITEIDNVLIRNFEMWLGSDVATVPNNTAKIYTNNTMTYKYLPGDSSTNSKTLNLLWYKKDETSGKYIKCEFTDKHDAIGELLAAQIQTKVSAQAGKEDGPTTVRALYAAAANKENTSNLSALTKLLQTDIKSLVRTFGSQSGLMNDDTVQKLVDVGAKANVWETGLKNWFEGLTDTAWGADADTIPNYHGYCNGVIAEMDEFFYEREEENDYPEQVANAVGTYDIYVAKWQVLKSKIEAYLSKIYPTAGDNKKLFDKTLSELEALTEDYDTWLEAQEAEAAEDEKEEYTCYWFKYDPSVTLTSDQAEFTSVAGTGWVVIDGNQGKTNIEVDCARNQETQRFKCIVAVNSLFYESNELVFTNEDELTSYETLDQADSLVIQHGSKSQDAYLLYGDDNYLLEKSNASVRRTLSLAYDGVLAGDEVMHNGHAFWYVPNSNTMLTIETAYLEAQGFIKQTSGDWAGRHSGYDCWYRKLVDVNHADEGAAAQDLDLSESTSECDYQGSNEFYYKIKEFYEPTASVNSIICEFVIADTEDPVYAETWFSFGQKGTSGTMYTLSITPQTNVSSTSPAREVETKVEDEDGKEITKWVDGGRLLLDVALYDGDMQPMELNNFSCEWVNKVGNNLSSEDGVITVPSETFGILKAKAVVDIINTDNDGIRTVDLTTLFAVPYSAIYKEIVNEKELTQTYVFSGPTRIIYTSLGVLDYTSLYRNPLKLYKRDGSEVTDITWSITHLPEGNGIDKKVLPTLDGKEETYLKPCETYFTPDDDVWCYVTAKDTDENILWQQPIIVTQSAYGYAVLNDWDGTLEIDETTGTIKGTMFMAGKKTSNNTFDGVVMGDVKTGLQSSKAGKVGIYGFNESIESFGLTIDGKAFFGKPGSGQIFFDGNKGTIRSSEWTENMGWGDGSKWRSDCKGMEIDFDDATIRMVGDTTEYATTEDGEYAYEVTDDNERKRVVSKNGDGVAPNIIITARPQDTKKTYFEIQGVKDGELSSLMKVGQEDYYLQSLGFKDDDNNHLGTKIDIGKGTITSYDFKINAFGGDPLEQTILLNSNPKELDDCYFKIGKDSGSFISFTKSGALDIYANKLTLASPLSSANLLRNTRPSEALKYVKDEDGKVTTTQESLHYAWSGNIYRASADGSGLRLEGNASQIIDSIDDGKWYTVSGNASSEITISIGSFSGKVSGTFVETFQNSGNNTTFSISGTAIVNNLKLEQNTSATPWCEHTDDAQQYADDKDTIYDEQLLQDQVFAKLTNNGDSRGIFLEGGQLYINADYLSTGIIRSNNWEGSYSGPDGKTYEKVEEYLQAKEAGLRSKEEEVRKKWDGFTPKITATNGMYINLNDGKIWSKTFELNAWDDSKGGIYLNSSPENDYYLRVGNNENHIYFHSTNGMTFQAKSGFLVNTIPSGEVNDDTKFLYLNSAGEGTITTEDGNKYEGIYFGVGQLGGENSSYAIYGNKKFIIKGDVYANGGKIGKMSIENDGVYISDINEQIKYSDDSISVCTIPFLAGQSLTADFGGFPSTWSKTYSESAQVKWIGDGQDSVNDSLQSECPVDFEFADGYSDYSSAQVYVTFPKISITRYENSKYIKTITIQIQPRNKEAGFSPGDGWQLVGRIKFSIGINQSGVTSITPQGVTARTLDGLDITLIRDDINYIKNNLGLSQSGDNSTSFSSANSFSEIKFITYNSSGDQITNAPKICGEPSADETKGALLLSDTIIGGEFLVRKSEDKTAIMSVKSGYSYFNFTDSIDFKVLNGRTVLQLTPEETYFNIGSTGSLLIKTNSSQAKFYNVDSKVGLLVPSILSTKIAYTDNTSLIELSTNKVSIIPTLKADTIATTKIIYTDSNNTSLIELSTGTVSVIPTLKVTGNIAAEGGLSVNGGKQASFTGNVIVSGTITNNGHTGKLGKLAFVDSVKKNFDISVSGNVTLEADISEYYTAEDAESTSHYYSINPTGGSGEVTFTHDASKDGQTETVTYTYPTYESWSNTTKYKRAVAIPSGTTKSVTKNITLKGNTDLELEASDTDTGTESISISGTQQ